MANANFWDDVKALDDGLADNTKRDGKTGDHNVQALERGVSGKSPSLGVPGHSRLQDAAIYAFFLLQVIQT